MSSEKKKIIIFDLDGVLFDTIPAAREQFLRLHPGVTEEMYHEMYALNIFEGAAKHAHLKIAETEEEKGKRLADYAIKKSKTKMFEGMKELLEDLHRGGCIIVLNTNAFAANSAPLLTNAGIAGLFDFVADAELSKDKAEKFKMIEDRYGADAERMIFVTDSLGDLRDAEKAGVPTIAVTWGVHGNDYFSREKSSCLRGVVGTVAELRDLPMR